MSQPPASANASATLRRVAAFWGTAFWLPVLLPLLALWVTSPGGRIDLPKFLQVALAPWPVLLLSAWWWATQSRRIGSGAFVLAAFWQGTIVVVLIVLALIASSGTGASLSGPGATDAEPLLLTDACVSVYLLLLGAVVAWRARRRLGETGTPPPATGTATRLWRGAFALLGPALLCVPLLAIPYFDAAAQRTESALLGEEIGRVRAQIPDLKDYEQVRSRVLARKMVLEQLESGMPRTAAALAVAGDLPPDARLTSLRADDDTLTLDLGSATSELELATIERLSAHGWRSIRVLPPATDPAAGVVRIQAHWPHEASP